MSLRQRMSSVSPSPKRVLHTSQLQPATLRKLLAASGEARASAVTLPAANEVAPADDYDVDDATIQRRPISGFAPRGSAESIPCFEDVTAVDSPGARVRPPASAPDTEITAVDAPAPDHADASGPRPILGRPVIDVGTPSSLPALPAPPQLAVYAPGNAEEEIAFEGLSIEPERASPEVFADTLAGAPPARRAVRSDVGTGPQPFRPGGALYAESGAGPTPSPWGVPSVPPPHAAPISPWHVHTPAAFVPAQAPPVSVPPPPESARRARAGRFALAACLFVVAFAGGAAIARATSASAPSPSHLWQSLRAHV